MPISEPQLQEKTNAAFSAAASIEGKAISIDAACRLLDTPAGEIRVAYGFGAGLAALMRSNRSYGRCFHPKQPQIEVATYLKKILSGADENITSLSIEAPLVAWHFNDRGPSVVLDNVSSGYATRLDNVTSFIRAEYGNEGKKYTCIYVAGESEQSHSVDNVMVCEYTNQGITVTQFLPPSVYNEKTYETNCRAIQYTYAWDIKNEKVVGAILTPRVLVGNVLIDADGLVTQFRNPFASLVKAKSDLGVYFDTTSYDIERGKDSKQRRLILYSNREYYSFKPFADRSAAVIAEAAPSWAAKPAARLSKLVQSHAQKQSMVGTIDIPAYISAHATVGLESMIFHAEDRVRGYNPLLLDENVQQMTEFLSRQARTKFMPSR
jgi:hypothetical protein